MSGYKIDLYFHGYKLAKEIDGNGDSNRNIDYEIKRQTIEQELVCEFTKIVHEKAIWYFLKLSMKYFDKSNSLVINWLNNWSKNIWKMKF